MSLDPDMLPAQVSADSSQPAPSPQPIDAAYQSASTGAQDVWFFMADADSQDRPSDEAVADIIAADNARQSTLAFHLFKKPKSTRIRCTLCLREKNEWRTWLNRIGGISRPMREHLSKEHPTTYNQKCSEQGQAAEPEHTPAGPSSNPPNPPPQPTPKPQTPRRESPQHIPPGPAPSAVPSTPGPPSSSHHVHAAYPQPPYPRPRHHTPWEPDRRKTALEFAQEAVDVVSRPRQSETIEELRAELEQVKAQRDHELNARRLLEQELYRMREAARARDEELIKVSQLISASLQALVGGPVSAPGAPPPVMPVQATHSHPHPHPPVAYPYPYPYPYPYNPS
ncbi:Lipase [Ceratobasidium sp. AG-Ba]|nr:Lipase [Ceratobasidium sp. AG-Ba]QRV98806.1 Lipase [Ceratobasidium sp. AG-Ba]